jgi:hypothetical protein
MKNPILVPALVLVSALAATGAMAQTGRPSEAPAAPAPHSTVVDTSQDAAGSYAHYLMLNGTPRDEAIRAAQAIDHPAPRKLAWHRDRASAAPAQTTR